MRKIDFDKQFIKDTAEHLEVYASAGFLDKPMLRQEYNVTVDSMHKDGDITEHQKNNWCIPDKCLNLSYLKKIRPLVKTSLNN